MSHQPSTRLGRSVLVLLGVLLLSAVAACASDDAQMPDDIVVGTLPSSTDRANCTDPTGDISNLVAESVGALSEPPGVDLVAAKAEVGDSAMKVTFTANGPVGEVTDPIFSLIHGVSGQEESFELRSLPASDGVWRLALITWSQEAGGLRESDPQPLDVPVTVAGNELTYSVPLTDIPKIVTIVWQFGASGTVPKTAGSTNRERVFDDCNNMGAQTGPGSSVTTDPSVPSDEPQGEPLGTAQSTSDDVTVTVFAFEKPAVDPEPLDVSPEAGFEVAVVEAEVCAGGQDVTVQPGNFTLLTSESELWPPWDPPQAAALPAFPGAGTLPAGSCVKGWITFEVPVAAQVTDVVFALKSGGSGADTRLWSV
jgi:hypothetical protein